MSVWKHRIIKKKQTEFWIRGTLIKFGPLQFIWTSFWYYIDQVAAFNGRSKMCLFCCVYPLEHGLGANSGQNGRFLVMQWRFVDFVSTLRPQNGAILLINTNRECEMGLVRHQNLLPKVRFSVNHSNDYLAIIQMTNALYAGTNANHRLKCATKLLHHRKNAERDDNTIPLCSRHRSLWPLEPVHWNASVVVERYFGNLPLSPTQNSKPTNE